MALGEYRHEPLYQAIYSLLSDKRNVALNELISASDMIMIYRLQGRIQCLHDIMFEMEKEKEPELDAERESDYWP